MLSICIPIYNFDVRPLISALALQMKKQHHNVELILIDDASSDSYKELNNSVCSPFHYIELDKNIGRSKIRNLFLKYAKFDYLLFLDCDSLIIDEDYLKKYIDFLLSSPQKVICGGRVYQDYSPSKKQTLRWKYGVKKESQTAEARSQAPNHSFMTNNFLINKDLLHKIKFDERLNKYGHEDTLFGYELLKHSIQITHIENAVDNGDIEENSLFLEKTEKGIENLKLIIDFVGNDDQLINMVTLLKAHRKVESNKLVWLLSLSFKLLNPLLKYSLKNGPICLWAFDFYKLGYLQEQYKKY